MISKSSRKWFFGMARKFLCLGLCVSMLGTSGFCGVAGATGGAVTSTVTDYSGADASHPYTSINVTGDGSHVRGICIGTCTSHPDFPGSGTIYVTKDCKITATKTGTTDTTGPRGIHLSGGSDEQTTVGFSNDIIVSAIDESGLSNSSGVVVQDIAMNMNGHNLTVSGVKGSSTGYSYGIEVYASPALAEQAVACELQTKGGDIAVKDVVSQKGNGYGIRLWSDDAVTNGHAQILTAGGSVLVNGVHANGTTQGTTAQDAIQGAYGISIKGDMNSLKTEGGDITVKNVSSSLPGVKIDRGYYGFAIGMGFSDNAHIENWTADEKSAGAVTIENISSSGTNGVAIGLGVQNSSICVPGSVSIKNISAPNGTAIAVGAIANLGDSGTETENTALISIGRINSTGELTHSDVQIEGDVAAIVENKSQTSQLKIALASKKSYLKGNLLTSLSGEFGTLCKNPGTIELELADGGTWYPVFGADTVTASENTTVKLDEGGVIDLAYTSLNTASSTPVADYTLRDYRTLKLGNLVADGGTFIVNTDIAEAEADKVVLHNVTDTNGKGVKVLVAYDPIVTTNIAKAESVNPVEIITDESNNLTKVEGGEYQFSSGAHSYKTTAEISAITDDSGYKKWGLSSLSWVELGLSPTAKATRSVAKAVGTAFLATTNTLQKRMGDLRNGAGSNMGWVRFTRTNNYFDDIKMNGNQYQVGYDRLISSDAVSKRYLGIAIDQYDGDNSFESGSSDVKSTTLGVYYTRMFESGHFYDFILRYGRVYGDWTSYDATLPTPTTKADFGVNTASVSAEYGYRWNIGRAGFYIEPQVELTAGYVSSGSNTTSAGDEVYMDSSRHFITRAGIAFGQRTKNFNYYFRGSYHHDFAGDTKVKFAGEDITTESPKNWFEATFGIGYVVKDSWYLYGEVSKLYRDINNSLNFNLGLRITL